MASGSTWPALHIFPIGDTFAPKQILLQPLTRIKIGRQTNAKTAPSRTNGYFDSKVLSRMHAEVWLEDGKIFIRDTKSSNGTFVNGERLSLEGVDSDPFPLQSNDVVEFGIDIVGDDNKTILHHKVAARVRLVLTADDAAFSAKEFEVSQRERDLYNRQENRRAANGIMAGTGTTQAKSNGMGLETVLARLKNELQKSRETSKELGRISVDMTEIGETLEGTRFPNPDALKRQQSTRHIMRDESIADATNKLRTELIQAQSSLSVSIERIQSLENVIEDQQMIRRDVEDMRSEIREAQIDLLRLRQSRIRDTESLDEGSISTLRDGPSESMSLNGLTEKSVGGSDSGQKGLPKLERNANIHSRLEALTLQLYETQRENAAIKEEHRASVARLSTLQDRFRALERYARYGEKFEEFRDDEEDIAVKEEKLSPSLLSGALSNGENGHLEPTSLDKELTSSSTNRHGSTTLEKRRRSLMWRCPGTLPMLGVIVIGLVAYAYINREI